MNPAANWTPPRNFTNVTLDNSLLMDNLLSWYMCNKDL